ncbi:MAG TPA: tetratricopeptide repeat protein [Candidatus Acidoferrum sp.]|nr:tetratricopeptide repeat protein [Candidatus Acidoferrum sp.]
MRPQLTIALLLVACFSVATSLDSKLRHDSHTEDSNVLTRFMGQGRKLFANHFFTRSDVYFHSGYYPSIFDQAAMKENHLAENAGAQESKESSHGEPSTHEHGPNCKHGEEPKDEHGPDCKHDGDDGHDCPTCKNGGEEHDFIGKPRNFMDRFSRNFIVTQHTHLTERGTNAAREILPWLKLSAQLDPNKIESYTVGAFWLRDLGKKQEAEEFLRQGLRSNPGSYELMLDLGRCYFERDQFEYARNLWNVAMQRWREQETSKPADKQNRFAVVQILTSLARVEARLGNREQAAEWLKIVKSISPTPDEIEKRIQEVLAGELLEPK